MKSPRQPQDYVRMLRGALKDYQQEHPDWQVEVLVSLIERSLRGLKQKMDAGTVTWEHPFTEFHFPVKWNWDDPKAEGIMTHQLIIGQLTEENTRNEKITVKTIAEMMVEQLNVMALQELTRHVWFQKEGEVYHSFLPPQIHDELQAIKSKQKRQEMLEQLFHPFSIGAACIDYGELKEGEPISRRAAKQLAKLDELIAINRIGFAGEINGRHIDLSLIFQIAPLVIDYEKQKAFHSITVGFFLAPHSHNSNVMAISPAEWTKKDIQCLWKEILAEVHTLTESLIPQSQSESSEILSINAQLEVFIAPENKHAVTQHIFQSLSQLGQVRQFAMQSLTPPDQRSEMQPGKVLP